jgi:hypothetical protein
MKNDQDISKVLRQLHVPASSKLDERIHAEIDNAVTPSGPELTFGQILTLLLKNKSIRYTLATTAALALLVVLILNHSTSSAFAMDQAIEAIKKYRGIHMTGLYTTPKGQTPLDAWARSDTTGNRLEVGLLTVSDVTVWTRDNKTYTYDRDEKKGYVQPGIDLELWFGPKVLAELANLKDYQAVEGDDAATGQRRVVVTCSLQNFHGPESLVLEFDARTKLLVSGKSWANLNREGQPICSIDRILYFENLPDSTFAFQPPADTQFTNHPLEVSEAILPVLSDPQYGISANGTTQEQACQSLLEQFWTAAIKDDWAQVRQLCPITATWPDELFRGLGDPNEIAAQVVKIGAIEQTGSSKLGSLALVPVRIRYQDNSVRDNLWVVQFRETDHGTSCVVAAPCGSGLDVKE